MVRQTGSQQTKHYMQAGKKFDESNLPPNREQQRKKSNGSQLLNGS